ncbi:hypothetical protein JYT28_01715, partial [Desulfobulbus sp. AH-315-M07]|nr:hypothetical protein [Desulfobulbus sp. AH-315-M07]
RRGLRAPGGKEEGEGKEGAVSAGGNVLPRGALPPMSPLGEEGGDTSDERVRFDRAGRVRRPKAEQNRRQN